MVAIKKPQDNAKQAIGWVVALLLRPGEHAAKLAAKKEEAAAAEEKAVLAVEAAMCAWQEASHVHVIEALEALRTDHAAANTKAAERTVFAKKYIDCLLYTSPSPRD